MGTSRKIKIGVLTSSRADFGIYLPLLKLLRTQNEEFDLYIIAFGSHTSSHYGLTKTEIRNHGFEIFSEIDTLLPSDDVASVALSFANTNTEFAKFWATQQHTFDWVLCLGDRFEMAAAVIAGIPFHIKFAHIHGGETTLGAIDNTYRHAITLASSLHFVSADAFKERVTQLSQTSENIYVTGALSLDNLSEIPFLTKEEFLEKWNIDLSKPSILITIHPETVAFEKNTEYAECAVSTLKKLISTHQLIITMPNADTMGSVFRSRFEKLQKENSNSVFTIENFGTQSYFTCMKYCDFLLGNTSSGIIEAASFNKYVINIGDRQKGRLCGENVIHVPFDESQLIAATQKISGLQFEGKNIYARGLAAPIIVEALKLNTL
jgi:GDP/UDP-N,N'-diacetylbacillosamine 2-epimerase (hydrolysing)